jgi:hypothetical protein
MKTIMKTSLFLLFALILNHSLSAQTSKSCGACQKPVSSYSKVGDYCPHCYVRWGYENTTTKYDDSYSYDNYESYSGIAYVTSNANLRYYASKSAYVVTVVPQYSSVTILGKYGSWYHVKYQGFDWYDSSTGYVHQSLVRM